jgi:hypothetical protein
MLAVLAVAFAWIASTFTNGLDKGLVAWLWDCLFPWVMIALVVGLPLLGVGGLLGLGHRPRESPESSRTPAESTDGSHDQPVTRRFAPTRIDPACVRRGISRHCAAFCVDAEFDCRLYRVRLRREWRYHAGMRRHTIMGVI